jgi:hypothetical protein
MTAARDVAAAHLLRERAIFAIGAPIALALVLCACNGRGPSGQVVAVVNGQEITRNDLDAEARATGVQNGPSITPTLLHHVIDRVLLAQATKRAKLDQYPGFPSDKVRVDQRLLAEIALKRALKPEPEPTDAEIKAYIAANPLAFSDRQKLRIDQIIIGGQIVPSPVRKAVSVDEAAKVLDELGAPYSRRQVIVDTMNLPKPIAEKLVSTPSGVFMFDQEGQAEVGSIILERQAVPMPPEAAYAEAKVAAARAKVGRDADAVLQTLWNGARIRLQSGYDPTIK